MHASLGRPDIECAQVALNTKFFGLYGLPARQTRRETVNLSVALTNNLQIKSFRGFIFVRLLGLHFLNMFQFLKSIY